jgi:hypothetical protein
LGRWQRESRINKAVIETKLFYENDEGEGYRFVFAGDVKEGPADAAVGSWSRKLYP